MDDNDRRRQGLTPALRGMAFVDAVRGSPAAGAVMAQGGAVATARLRRRDRTAAKIMDRETLLVHVASWKSDGRTIAVANGCFDMFHRGHAALVEAASRCADRLIMAINSDGMVRRLKGSGRPVHGEQDRAFRLAAIGHVDAVVIFGEETPEELLRRILPDVLVKGGDYTVDRVVGRQYAKRIALVEYIHGYSTTEIAGAARKG